MSKELFTWRGESGELYEYAVFEMPFEPDANNDGNYIFAKCVGDDDWQPVYIGQGELKDAYNRAIEKGCVQKHGATHYHMFIEADMLRREAEEADLIKGYPQCMEPDGCNEVVPQPTTGVFRRRS